MVNAYRSSQRVFGGLGQVISGVINGQNTLSLRQQQEAHESRQKFDAEMVVHNAGAGYGQGYPVPAPAATAYPDATEPEHQTRLPVNWGDVGSTPGYQAPQAAGRQQRLTQPPQAAAYPGVAQNQRRQVPAPPAPPPAPEGGDVFSTRLPGQ